MGVKCVLKRKWTQTASRSIKLFQIYSCVFNCSTHNLKSGSILFQLGNVWWQILSFVHCLEWQPRRVQCILFDQSNMICVRWWRYKLSTNFELIHHNQNAFDAGRWLMHQTKHFKMRHMPSISIDFVTNKMSLVEYTDMHDAFNYELENQNVSEWNDIVHGFRFRNYF